MGRVGLVLAIASTLACGCGGAPSREPTPSPDEPQSLGEPTRPPAAIPTGAPSSGEIFDVPVTPIDDRRVRFGGVIARTELRDAFADDAVLVGVTADPYTGELFVLDASRGLYRFQVGQAPELVFDVRDAPLLPSAFTDVAALGDGRFALTVINDGFILDIASGTLSQHFCYFPDSGPKGAAQSVSERYASEGVLVHQRTEALAFSEEYGLLYAQPQTIDERTNAVLGSEVAAFDAITGEDLAWVTLPETGFQAGGMVALGLNVLLGLPQSLWLVENDAATMVASNAEFGISRVDGMTLSSRRTLIVLDAPARALIEIAFE